MGVGDIISTLAGRFRLTEAGKQATEERIAAIRRELARCHAIITLEGQDGWFAFQEDIKDKLKGLKSLMDTENLPDLPLRVANISRIRLEGFLNYVDDAKARIPNLEAALAVALKERERYGK